MPGNVSGRLIEKPEASESYLGWLADLLADRLPLVVLVLLDGVVERSFLQTFHVSNHTGTRAVH